MRSLRPVALAHYRGSTEKERAPTIRAVIDTSALVEYTQRRALQEAAQLGAFMAI